MDPLLLLAYFAVPGTITLVAFVGLKLHERSAPTIQADPAAASWSSVAIADNGIWIIDSAGQTVTPTASAPTGTSKVE